MDNLSDILGKQKWFRYLKFDATVTLKLQRNWSELAGELLSKQLQVSYVRGKLLVLEATNPCWIQEIEFYKKPLLLKLNLFLKSKVELTWVKVVIV